MTITPNAAIDSLIRVLEERDRVAAARQSRLVAELSEAFPELGDDELDEADHPANSRIRELTIERLTLASAIGAARDAAGYPSPFDTILGA